MKIFKKNSFLLIILLCFCSFNVSASESEYILYNQGSPDDVLKNEIIKSSIYERLNNLKLSSDDFSLNALPSYKSMSIFGYPNYQQEKNYYCGPAVVKQAVQYLKGSSLYQSTYASHMNTDIDGNTAVYRITNELNSQLGVNVVFHELVSNNLEDAMFTLASFADLTYVLNNPLILHSTTRSLYMYNGRVTNHYLTAIGYGGWSESNSLTTNEVTDIIYVDTFYNDYGRGSVFGMHTDSLENVANSVKGRYLIVSTY